MSKLLFPVILEYCGGEQTDLLFEQLSDWNPSFSINVFDNGSFKNLCTCATYRRDENLNVGGGIKLARDSGASYALVITNDINPNIID